MPIKTLDGYTGFSSKNFERNKSFIIKNIEVVKNDLLNHIFTRKGARVKMFKFGTRIPDIQFQPLDEITLGIIEEDLRMVVAFYPRVSLRDLRLLAVAQDNMIIAVLDLNFLYLNFNDTLDVHIEYQK